MMSEVPETTRGDQGVRATSLVTNAEARTREVGSLLLAGSKSALGQFMTPPAIGQFMASLFEPPADSDVRILDAGAGVGSLTAALVQALCQNPRQVAKVAATCYEIDPTLIPYLEKTLRDCQEASRGAGLEFHTDVRPHDFIEHATANFARELFTPQNPDDTFTHAILNPPYRKIQTASLHRKLLSRAGIETTNLYAAFVALAIRLLAPGGQLVAITPRSFCNGPYFLPFRKLLLSEMAILHIHTFERRDQAFRDDEVLQENVIFFAKKAPREGSVTLSSSLGPEFENTTSRTAAFSEVIVSGDPNLIIHIPIKDQDKLVAAQLGSLRFTLEELGIKVSTGPIVDFRLKQHIRDEPRPTDVPLLYPVHFRAGVAQWPDTHGRKPNAIALSDYTRKWLLPQGHYTLTRRFSSKEERRRVVASIFEPQHAPGQMVGFENHLNVFHIDGHGLPPRLARGLCIYLNSTLIDRFFRVFNGHTQVNAADLRNLRYPSRDVLEQLASTWESGPLPPQESIDALVERALAA